MGQRTSRSQTGLYCLDVFREPHFGGTWTYRRDERLRMPYPSVITRSAKGTPFMAPEIVLLFKAKHPRERDEFDVSGMLPTLLLALAAATAYAFRHELV